MDKAKKLQTNAKYLSKFKAVPVRVPLEEWDAVSAAAEKAGQAVSAYALQAVRERMARDAEKRD